QVAEVSSEITAIRDKADASHAKSTSCKKQRCLPNLRKLWECAQPAQRVRPSLHRFERRRVNCSATYTDRAQESRICRPSRLRSFRSCWKSCRLRPFSQP